jgi:hypothetical protein
MRSPSQIRLNSMGQGVNMSRGFAHSPEKMLDLWNVVEGGD